MENYLSLPTPDLRCGVSGFFDAVVGVGDAGVVLADLGQLAGYVSKLCGSETFALLSCTDRDIFHAMCERSTARKISGISSLYTRNR